MPKPTSLSKKILTQIKSGRLKMKPRWYFIFGSVLSFVGLAGIFVGVIFLLNLFIFLVRRQGMVNPWRFAILVHSFPLWIPALAFFGLILGVSLLKRYDFSYRKNFILIVLTVLVAVLFASWSLDRLGLNDTWAARGPMRHFYQKLNPSSPPQFPHRPKGSGAVRGAPRRFR